MAGDGERDKRTDDQVETYLRSYVESAPEERSILDPLRRGRLPLALVGLVGFVIGVFLWGSLLMAMVSGVQSIVDDTDASGNGANGDNGEVVTEAEPLTCEGLVEREALSAEEEAFFEENCVPPEEDEEPPPADEGDEEPDEPILNREDCEEIRGTDYFSPEERTWFLANCVTG